MAELVCNLYSCNIWRGMGLGEGGRGSSLMKVTWLADTLPLRPQNVHTHPDPPPMHITMYMHLFIILLSQSWLQV